MTELNIFQDAIAAKYDAHCEAFSAGDADRLVREFFAEDAMWSGPGLPERLGRADLLTMFRGLVAGATVSHTPGRARVDGNRGWDFRDWHVQPRDGSSGWTFRSLFCWVRRDGEWLCDAVNCFVADQ